MSDSKTVVIPLKGKNYATWKIQCRMSLIKDSLWSIVNGTEVAPVDNAEQEVTGHLLLLCWQWIHRYCIYSGIQKIHKLFGPSLKNSSREKLGPISCN